MLLKHIANIYLSKVNLYHKEPWPANLLMDEVGNNELRPQKTIVI